MEKQVHYKIWAYIDIFLPGVDFTILLKHSELMPSLVVIEDSIAMDFKELILRVIITPGLEKKLHGPEMSN